MKRHSEAALEDSVHTRFALPTDADLDRFSSGVAEVDAYFRTRQWFNKGKNKASPPTYQFSTRAGGEVVGYAAAGFRNCGHPTDADETRSRYLVIYVAGVHERFHGVVNPESEGDTYAVSIFRVLERLAAEKPSCVGLYLMVRQDDLRAIRFYEKYGFEAEAAAVQRDNKAPHLTMRKLFSA